MARPQKGCSRSRCLYQYCLYAQGNPAPKKWFTSSEPTLALRTRVVYMKILVKFEVFPTVLRLVPVDREVRRARRFCLFGQMASTALAGARHINWCAGGDTTSPLSVGVLVMSFFTLSSDIILIILEELDPLSLFHFCLVCHTPRSPAELDA